MGKRIIFNLTILLFSVLTTVCVTTVCSEENKKISYFEMERVIEESDMGKKEYADYWIFYNKRMKPIKEAEKNLHILKEELDKQGPVKSRTWLEQNERNNKESNYKKKTRDYQLLYGDTKEECEKRKKELVNKITPKIMKVVKKIRKEEKYTATPIIDIKTEVPKGENITDKVIKEFNRYYASGFQSKFLNTASNGEPEKIGFYEEGKVFQGTDMGKKAAADFKGYYDEKTKTIKEAEKNLYILKDELAKQGPTMTQMDREKKERTYQRKMRDYQLLVNDTNEELKKRDDVITEKLKEDILKVVEKIKKEEKYTDITSINDVNTEEPEGDNITEKVIKEFNRYYASEIKSKDFK